MSVKTALDPASEWVADGITPHPVGDYVSIEADEFGTSYQGLGGVNHRLDGPAVIIGENEDWWVDGRIVATTGAEGQITIADYRFDVIDGRPLLREQYTEMAEAFSQAVRDRAIAIREFEFAQWPDAQKAAMRRLREENLRFSIATLGDVLTDAAANGPGEVLCVCVTSDPVTGGFVVDHVMTAEGPWLLRNDALASLPHDVDVPGPSAPLLLATDDVREMVRTIVGVDLPVA